jgi:hypothetical protein
LGQKWCLEANFGADPFAFSVGSVGCVITAAAATKLRAKVGGLNLIELANFFPGGIADRARNVDFEL